METDMEEDLPILDFIKKKEEEEEVNLLQDVENLFGPITNWRDNQNRENRKRCQNSDESEPFPLLLLSDELIFQVLISIGYPNLFRLRQICLQLKALIDSSIDVIYVRLIRKDFGIFFESLSIFLKTRAKGLATDNKNDARWKSLEDIGWKGYVDNVSIAAILALIKNTYVSHYGWVLYKTEVCEELISNNSTWKDVYQLLCKTVSDWYIGFKFNPTWERYLYSIYVPFQHYGYFPGTNLNQRLTTYATDMIRGKIFALGLVEFAQPYHPWAILCCSIRGICKRCDHMPDLAVHQTGVLQLKSFNDCIFTYFDEHDMSARNLPIRSYCIPIEYERSVTSMPPKYHDRDVVVHRWISKENLSVGYVTYACYFWMFGHSMLPYVAVGGPSNKMMNFFYAKNKAVFGYDGYVRIETDLSIGANQRVCVGPCRPVPVSPFL